MSKITFRERSDRTSDVSVTVNGRRYDFKCGPVYDVEDVVIDAIENSYEGPYMSIVEEGDVDSSSQPD